MLGAMKVHPRDGTDEPFARLASVAGVEDESRLTDPNRGRQGAGAPARMHLVVGPVGAGKSTFAARLATVSGAMRLTLDEWMSRLFSPDRPASAVVEWYVERAARCVDQIWAVARQAIAVEVPVILEIGLLSRAERARFYERVLEAGVALTVHVVDAPRDVRRKRVEARNREKGETFSMIVPPAIFELASDMWEAPDDEERARTDIELFDRDLT